MESLTVMPPAGGDVAVLFMCGNYENSTKWTRRKSDIAMGLIKRTTWATSHREEYLAVHVELRWRQLIISTLHIVTLRLRGQPCGGVRPTPAARDCCGRGSDRCPRNPHSIYTGRNNIHNWTCNLPTCSTSAGFISQIINTETFIWFYWFYLVRYKRWKDWSQKPTTPIPFVSRSMTSVLSCGCLIGGHLHPSIREAPVDSIIRWLKTPGVATNIHAFVSISGSSGRVWLDLWNNHLLVVEGHSIK